jgi:hypothetical protein
MLDDVCHDLFNERDVIVMPTGVPKVVTKMEFQREECWSGFTGAFQAASGSLDRSFAIAA